MQRLLVTQIDKLMIASVCDDMTIQTVHVIEENSLLGSIYVGRVENIVSNIQAAFIEFSKGQRGYYSLKDNKKHIILNSENTDELHIGDTVLVQVSREGIRTKEPTLTGKLSLTGIYCVVLLNTQSEASSVFVSKKITDKERCRHLKALVETLLAENGDDNLPAVDIIIRTNAENVPDDAVIAEAAKMTGEMYNIMKRAGTRTAFTRMYIPTSGYLEDVQNINFECLDKIITDIPEVYDNILGYLEENEPAMAGKLELYSDSLISLAKLYSVEGQLNDALRKKVWLRSGGYLVIENTEALTVIDVNTGKCTGGRCAKGNMYLKINLEAAEEIGKQLALRNLSGIIIVDFIDMESKEDRKKLLDFLSYELAFDVVPTEVVDMTRLGLVEITRKKIRKPLHEAIAGIYGAAADNI